MAGEIPVTIGTRVRCTDGACGWVSRVVVEPQDSHVVTHLLLKETGVLGRKRVAVPIGAVSRVDAGIQLNITRRQVRQLPRYTGPAELS